MLRISNISNFHVVNVGIDTVFVCPNTLDYQYQLGGGGGKTKKSGNIFQSDFFVGASITCINGTNID